MEEALRIADEKWTAESGIAAAMEPFASFFSSIALIYKGNPNFCCVFVLHGKLR